LIGLVPLVGARLGRFFITCFIALNSFSLAALYFLKPSFISMDILSLCGAATILAFITAFIFARYYEMLKINGHSSSKKNLTAVKEEHSLIKKKVADQEMEETRSLQIYGISKSLAESLSWKEMGPRLTSGVEKLFGAFDILIYAINDQGQEVPLVRRGNWSKEPPFPIKKVKDVQFIHPPQVAEPVPVLSVPIFTMEGEITNLSGVLLLKTSDAARKTEDLLAIGRDFGEQLGVALKKAILFNQIEMQSRLDGLTGTLRRQAFMDRLAEEFKRAAVFHTPFSVMMVDIDHFKSVNDTHGHAAGDAVLNRIGQVLKESFYETDVVGRYGGEEFIVLLPRAESEGVLKKAEALRKRLESEIIPAGFENLRVTVSIGVAHYPLAGRTAEDLIGGADKALYQAKETGRNRVIAA
jgi:diguanylate cyclase (GGDEF)-like protein